MSGVKVGAVKTSSINNDDGIINATGNIKDWDTLPMSEKRFVYKERKRLGVKYGGNTKGKGSAHNTNASNVNTIHQLCKKNNNLKRKIKAIKFSDSNETVNNDDVEDAGDEFGGKYAKRKKQDKS